MLLEERTVRSYATCLNYGKDGKCKQWKQGGGQPPSSVNLKSRFPGGASNAPARAPIHAKNKRTTNPASNCENCTHLEGFTNLFAKAQCEWGKIGCEFSNWGSKTSGQVGQNTGNFLTDMFKSLGEKGGGSMTTVAIVGVVALAAVFVLPKSVSPEIIK